ncbi:MAG: WD40 repeat domain-containing protein [Anaerolineales bacterium]|nr:MAG: WD40 repeat domain-containing protein [Anaerolineales bacterium]
METPDQTHIDRPRAGRDFWPLWALAPAVIGALSCRIGAGMALDEIILAPLAMLIFGFWVGIVQAFALRRQGRLAYWWILTSSLAGMVAGGVSFFTVAVGVFVFSSSAGLLGGWAAAWAAYGAMCGVVHWPVLRRQRVPRSHRAMLGSLAGWTTAGVVGGAVGWARDVVSVTPNTFVPVPAVRLTGSMEDMMVVGAVYGATGGAITGAVLLWLLRQPVPPEGVVVAAPPIHELETAVSAPPARSKRVLTRMAALPALLLGAGLIASGGIGTVTTLAQGSAPDPTFELFDLRKITLVCSLVFVVIGVLTLMPLSLPRDSQRVVSEIGAGASLVVVSAITLLSIIEGPVLPLTGTSLLIVALLALVAGNSALTRWRLRGRSSRWVVIWWGGAVIFGPCLLLAAVPIGIWLSLPLTLEGHPWDVRSVAWSPNGRWLASGDVDGTIMVWDAEVGEQILTLKGHMALEGYRAYEGYSTALHSLAWSPDGARIGSGAGDKTIIIWNARTGERQHTLAGHTAPVYSLTWSPAGDRIASGSPDGKIIIWDAVAGKRLSILASSTSGVNDVAWSPDGTQLASASEHGTLILWDAGTREQRRTLEGHAGEVYSVAWSPDGARLASASEDGSVIVLDVETGENMLTIDGAVAADAAWSPDGRTLASVTLYDTVTVWNAETGKELRFLNYHAYGSYPADFVPSNAAWSPDGKTIAHGSEELVVLWERPLALRPFCLLTNKC